MLAPPAFAAEDPPVGLPDTQVEAPGTPTLLIPQCFGEPATIVMSASGGQLGTAGDDVIVGTDGDDFIDSLGGNDRICAGGGVDRIIADRSVTGVWDLVCLIVVGEASSDDDFIDGQDDGDVIAPGCGNDHVWGSDGPDFLYGQLGDDTIYGGDHEDWMDCDEGDDYADGGRGNQDSVNPGHGCETLISAAVA
jgi:Ca2+-binding RTX toxin-like protein